MLREGHKVTVGGNASQRAFLEEAIPGLRTLQLEGYGVQYSRKRGGFMIKIITQLPIILFAIRLEHLWLQETQEKEQFDGIISDNRYGLHHANVNSVILTHQLQVRTGLGKLATGILRKNIFRMLRRFNATWVVDTEPENSSLAGELSHASTPLPQLHYLGLLSAVNGEKKDRITAKKIVILLSGPEPQRSILSELLWKQIASVEDEIIFIEGSEHAPERINFKNTKQYKRLPPQEVEQHIRTAAIVVCRGGYTSLMDLARLGIPALVIPTPGQTEQEYLADRLAEKKMLWTWPQLGFQLLPSLQTSLQEPRYLEVPDKAFEQYQTVLSEWVASL